MLVDYASGCKDARIFHVLNETCEHGVAIAVGCGNRFKCFCEHCSRSWQRKTRARFFDAISCYQRPKFLTLTLKKHKGRFNFFRIWEMRKALFRKLRDAGHVIRSWVGCVEFPNHVHMVIDSDYLPQWEISNYWHTVTGDSFYVDIRALKASDYSYRKAIAYISKYITKIVEFPSVKYSDFAGFHLIGSYGNFVMPQRTLVCPICSCKGHWIRISEEEFYANRMDKLEPLANFECVSVEV